MAKLSRRKRAKLKEKETRRALAKVGEPYSKHITRVCYHFNGRGGGFVRGYAFPTLVKISDEKCVCLNCKSEFPVDFIVKMEKLTAAYANAGCTAVIDARNRLIANCNPVKFYYIGPNEICYVDEDKK